MNAERRARQVQNWKRRARRTLPHPTNVRVAIDFGVDPRDVWVDQLYGSPWPDGDPSSWKYEYVHAEYGKGWA